MGDHVLTYYALPGGVKLELISYMSDTGDCTAGLLERGRFRHLALRVDDLETLAARLGDFAALGGAAGLYRNAGGRPQWL